MERKRNTKRKPAAKTFERTYDKAAKSTIATRQFLAMILKERVPEFHSFDLDTIERDCIEGTPRVGEVPKGVGQHVQSQYWTHRARRSAWRSKRRSKRRSERYCERRSKRRSERCCERRSANVGNIGTEPHEKSETVGPASRRRDLRPCKPPREGTRTVVIRCLESPAGEACFADLMAALFNDGRAEDAKRAASDVAYRNALFHEYHMDGRS